MVHYDPLWPVQVFKTRVKTSSKVKPYHGDNFVIQEISGEPLEFLQSFGIPYFQSNCIDVLEVKNEA